MNGLSTSSSSLSSSSTSSKDSKNAKSGKKFVKMGCGKIWENRHHIPYWPSWLTPKKGQTKPKQSSAKSYYSRVPLKVSIAMPKRNTTMVSTPQVLVQPKRQSHSVELLRHCVKYADNQYHCSQRFNNPISRPPEPTGTGTVPALVPTITFVVWREPKIPATVGANTNNSRHRCQSPCGRQR